MLIIKNLDLRRQPETKMPAVLYGNTEDRENLRFMCADYFINVTPKFAAKHTGFIYEPGQYAEFNAELTRKNGKITLVDVAKDDITTTVLLSIVADKKIKFRSNKGHNMFYLFDIANRKHMFLGFQFSKGATYTDINIIVESETEDEINVRLEGPGHKSHTEVEIPYSGKPRTEVVEGADQDNLAEYQKVLMGVKQQPKKAAYEKTAVKVDDRPKAILIADHSVKEAEALRNVNYNVTKVLRAKRTMELDEISAYAENVAKQSDIIVIHHSVSAATALSINKAGQANGKTVLLAIGKGYSELAM